ncbi:hypothetical protein IFU39_16845 [Paenibacillus sp. CFBP 13594]|uniref:hypothetical protein n=1 Tax=Paenibacillus sp. CFBP 13594 TaxID=2774037 RepID=UPI0017807FAC|nr:hypothetical protein [Paenibacillus sp. CFBP 13594]MBD8839482.1 hypothetical protein [Paenibacillus sp. CFBP 13594]
MTDTEQKKTPTARKTRTRLDESLLVPIVSRVKGGLTYKSSRTHQIYRFDEFGDEQVMELSELRTMLSSQRSFLQRGWLEILDEEIVQYLNIEKFQTNIITDDDIEILFMSTPDEVKEVLNVATTNTKRVVFGFAREKYINGELTNIHLIKAIEDSLDEKLDPNI